MTPARSWPGRCLRRIGNRDAAKNPLTSAGKSLSLTGIFMARSSDLLQMRASGLRNVHSAFFILHFSFSNSTTHAQAH
jgi:hypothetical protein